MLCSNYCRCWRRCCHRSKFDDYCCICGSSNCYYCITLYSSGGYSFSYSAAQKGWSERYIIYYYSHFKIRAWMCAHLYCEYFLYRLNWKETTHRVSNSWMLFRVLNFQYDWLTMLARSVPNTAGHLDKNQVHYNMHMECIYCNNNSWVSLCACMYMSAWLCVYRPVLEHLDVTMPQYTWHFVNCLYYDFSFGNTSHCKSTEKGV